MPVFENTPRVRVFLFALLLTVLVSWSLPFWNTTSTYTRASATLTLVAPPYPSVVNQTLTLQGVYKDSEESALVQQFVVIQFSKDLRNWHNITAQTDANGSFSLKWTPESSGALYINATASRAKATCRHLVADYIVSTPLDLIYATREGGVVFVRSGIYDLNPTLHYPYNQLVLRSNLSIVGEGMDRTIVRMFPTQQPVESAAREDMVSANSSVENLLISNLTLTQNGTPDNLGSCVVRIGNDSNCTCQGSCNITIENVRVNNCFGGAISITYGTNIKIENSVVENAWTGIRIADSRQVQINNNRIMQCKGDSIYFPETSKNVTIQGNMIADTGDTAIDFSSWRALQPHQEVIIENNKIINGKHIRITNSISVNIIKNTLKNTDILIDAGQATPRNIRVSDNVVTTNGSAAIRFLGAVNSNASNNTIVMTEPDCNLTQSGIIIAIVGIAEISNNIVLNAQNYGLSFGGYGLGGATNLTITGNQIINFGEVGIWDDGKKQGGLVIIKNNTIWDNRDPFASRYGIKTDCTANKFVIVCNTIYAGIISYVSAPSSQVVDNIYAPPS